MIFVTLVCALVFLWLLEIFLSFSQIDYIKRRRFGKAEFMSQSAFEEAADYAITTEKFGLVCNVFGMAVKFFFLFFGFTYLHEFFAPSLDGQIAYFLVWCGLLGVASLPFGYYQTFYIEAKFKLTNMTKALFFKDALKNGILYGVIIGIFCGVFLWAQTELNSLWWLVAFCVIFGFMLLFALVYPLLDAWLFTKVRPLEDGVLRTRILSLLEQTGFKSKGVFVSEASKRSKKLNAYFGGLGKTKRVVLFDTLVEKLTDDEIIAVLAHELGHFKHKDILKRLAFSLTQFFLLFAIVGNVPAWLVEECGLPGGASGVLLFLFVFSPLFTDVFEPLESRLSRASEFAADDFGARLGGAENLSSALLKLTEENKSFPFSYPLYAAFYHSHPSVPERVTRLRELSKA